MERKELRWVSCSKDSDWATSLYRHLGREKWDGYTDTVCGATGSPGAFRGDSKKAKCPKCLAKVGGE